MSNPDFRTAIRNQALTVKGDMLAGQIQKLSAAALRKELAELSGTRYVRDTARNIPQGESPVKPAVAQAGPQSMAPEALCEVFSQASEVAMLAIYSGIQDWSMMTTLNGVMAQGVVAISSPGCLKPGECPTMKSHLDLGFASATPQMQTWAKKFAEGLVKGANASLSAWATSFSIVGLPLFPAPGPGVPYPMSQASQSTDLLSVNNIDAFMMSSGARVDNLPNSGSKTSSRHSLDSAARMYVARVTSGMLKFAISISQITNLLRLPMPPNVPIGPVISTPGVLRNLGENLPHPSKWSVNGFPSSGIDLALREDLKKVALGAVDAPNAPPPPG